MKNPAGSIRVGKITFAVWRLGDGRFAFDYKEGSRRRVVARKKFDALKAAAERIAIKILNGETDAITLTPQDCRTHVAAREQLVPFGLAVDAAARDIAEAHRISGGISLRDLALFHKRNFAAMPVEKTVNQCIEHVLAQIRERSLSDRFVRDMTNDGKRIREWFGARLIGAVLAEEILAKLREHQAERRFGWKRRNHLRGAFVYIWNEAKNMGWLPQDRDNAAVRIAPLEEPLSYSAIQTYTPEEMRFFIAHIAPKYLPWLVICGFSTVRSEEVAPPANANKDRLRWSDFHWAKKYIRIRREVSKTGRKKPEPRNVPMPDCLIAWLAPFRDRTGPVCMGEQPSKRETSRLSRVAAEKGLDIRWKHNALRHTVISARLGLTHDRARVAEEAGTSDGKIRKNYNEGFDEDQAQALYSIFPDYAENVLPLWQQVGESA